ncbi:MAG: tRNA uridine-5-carboxymethylaminomethyl(34) synthesis GTPase MnmE [Pseudomonadota bacterium]
MVDDTIYALATPGGTGAVAVIRISGPNAHAALTTMLVGALPPHRMASRRWLMAADGRRLDQALVLRFDGPASFTGEDVVELHCHGGRAVVQAVLQTLCDDPRLRLADPGEFTWCAYRNGRLDLTQVEALGDLIAADTERQRHQAISGVSGAVREMAEEWRLTLIEALATVEASIDWADEEVPENVDTPVRARLLPIIAAIADLEAAAPATERLRGGYEAILIGPPNSGKSTLFNTLAGREVAIASPQPGTTRDTLEVSLDLQGLPVTLIDTAGLRTDAEGIEEIGITRARDRAKDADLRIILVSPDTGALPDIEDLKQPDDITVASKSDLGVSTQVDCMVSALEGDGIAGLLAMISARLSKRAAGAGVIGHERQRRAIGRARAALETAEQRLGQEMPELVAEEVRTALKALESLVGRVAVDDVLDSVFSRFCLGK